MQPNINITAVDNELVIIAYQWDISYIVARILSGNSKKVSVNLTINQGNYSGPFTANGVNNPIDEPNAVITLPAGNYSLVGIGIDWGGPQQFQAVITTNANPATVTWSSPYQSTGDGVVWNSGTPIQISVPLPYTRKNAWDANNGGQFTKPDGSYTDLYWYAKAVQVMQSRPVSDPTSWWFYAAIHGEYLVNAGQGYPNWNFITYINKNAQLGTLPTQKLINTFWDQCQHASWYFAPWHRGYLVALENLLRTIVVGLPNGPSDWALPYWNYLNQSSTYKEYNIPPAFTASQLPDGTANPLYVPERYGPDGDSNIYVDTSVVNDNCQNDTTYTGQYGGGSTSHFTHFGSSTGDLEQNPHNIVHGEIGGNSSTNPKEPYGLMADPGIAALDPIFYLHHANIDRMWAAWNVTGGNSNPTAPNKPTDPNWPGGPAASGYRAFAMPVDSNGTAWYYTPGDVNSTTSVNYYNSAVYSYTYDDLNLTSEGAVAATPSVTSTALRLTKLGVIQAPTTIQGTNMLNQSNSELVGASSGSVSFNSSGKAEAQVQLDSSALNVVSQSLLNASASNLPDSVFLLLEGVKGNHDANILTVYVNQKPLKSVQSLFGLRKSSIQTSSHGGGGLTLKFDITDIIDDLHLSKSLDINSLDVQIVAKNQIPSDSSITIGRIAIYRVGQ